MTTNEIEKQLKVAWSISKLTDPIYSKALQRYAKIF